ncbi:hypothetical protein SDC9_154741 [bioreactor metagenome]|uniref:DUF4368 domain-containing protein n=1 Tax=bioreactor metagenome TaxID=1076179 RepID=A0A645EZK5_9ZZZZ
MCDNKEIRKEYIEEYVLSELERKIFNDKAIEKLVKGINNNLKKQQKSNEQKKEALVKELSDIGTQINNIISAIASGFMQDEFKIKIEELKARKLEVETTIIELNSDEKEVNVSEEDVRKLLNNFSSFVTSRNIPECKKFIQDFVKEVIVHKGHVEVIFNVTFNLLKSGKGVEVESKIDRYNLYESYSQSFYIGNVV